MYEKAEDYKDCTNHCKDRTTEYCYPAIFCKEGKYINLWFPDISEAYTFAENEKELWRSAREVLEMSIEGRIADKVDIPYPSAVCSIKLKENEHIVLITVSC